MGASDIVDRHVRSQPGRPLRSCALRSQPAALDRLPQSAGSSFAVSVFERPSARGNAVKERFEVRGRTAPAGLSSRGEGRGHAPLSTWVTNVRRVLGHIPQADAMARSQQWHVLHGFDKGGRVVSSPSRYEVRKGRLGARDW